MIDSQIMPAFAAVLTRVVVAMQHVAARQANFFVWNLHVTSESDDGWKWKTAIYNFAVMLDALSLSFQDEDHCSAPTAYVQWFV